MEATYLTSAACEGPLGAVRPLDRPSWLTVEPRITTCAAVPAKEVPETRRSTSAAKPSPRPYPSPLQWAIQILDVEA
jgi:hypothetical protein